MQKVMPNSVAKAQDNRHLRQLITKAMSYQDPVDWLFTHLTDTQLTATHIRRLAQKLDRHADAMERR